ncbi:MAG: trigger factor [Gemmatimonadota bacterium]
MAEITVQRAGGDVASKRLQITVPAERVREAEEKVVRTYARRARLPGFRPGRAPEGVVRKRFSEAIRQSVLEEMIRESWETAKTQEALKPVADPSITNLKFDEGGPIEFELVVEIRPELTLARTGGFTLTRTVPPVTDADVAEQLQRLQEQKARWLPVEGAKPAPGNLVRVTVTSADADPASAQPSSLVLGEGQAIPELEERIMSLLPGETVEAEVRFPDDFPDQERRGQSRKVRVTLHEVKRKELPALDDTFARELGDFDSLAALEAAVREDLEKDAQRTADAGLREQLVAQLVEANAVPAPESMVHRFLHSLAAMYQIPQDRLGAFEQEFHAMAEAQVRRELVLSAVAETEKLYATEAEVDARVQEMAAARNVPPAQLYASLEKANRLRDLERQITEEKVFAWLLRQSTVTEA